MSQLRYDPISDRWVCIAENRMGRPFEFRQTVARRSDLDCPFCLGNESQTPPAIHEVAHNGSGGDQWLVRIFPNKYPAFDEASPGLEYLGPPQWAPEQKLGTGRQEVIVISPRHITSLAELNADELSASFDVFRQRVANYQQYSDVQHVCLFMNCRPQAGASIEHAHFQLIGAPICSKPVRRQYDRMINPGVDYDGSIWEQMIDFEMRSQVRVLEQSPRFLTVCPYASKHAFQIRIIPTDLGTAFSRLHDDGLAELSAICQRWVCGLEACLDLPAYNLVFFLPPTATADRPWFVEIIPRLSRTAGFELATDFWLNSTSPETAAKKLRGDTD